MFYAGLYVVTREESEVWFEFWNANTRDECLKAISDALTAVRGTDCLAVNSLQSPAYRRFSQSWQLLDEIHRIEKQFPDKVAFSEDQLFALPPIVSTSSTIVIPARPLRITCLTIGTRGDVQPYIALCKVNYCLHS